MALRVVEGERLLGAVDCLSSGFAKINRMPWILLFPVAMGLFLWRGPMLSAAPAIDSMATSYSLVLPSDLIGPAADSTGEGSQLVDVVHSLFGDLNLFSFLTFGIGIAGRGTIPAAGAVTMMPLVALPAVHEPRSAVALAVAIELFGLLLGVVYLGLIAQRVRDEATSVGGLVRRVWRYWLSLVGFVTSVLVGAMIVSIPVALVLALAFSFAEGVAGAVLVAVVMGWQVALIWLTIFMFFVVDAAVVGELGPWAAARSSLRVVRARFWPAVGFIVLYLVITYGMLALWSQLGDEPWAVLLGILGNAYVASGLAAGSMIYYRTRTVSLGGVTPK